MNFANVYEHAPVRYFLLALIHLSHPTKFASNCLSLFYFRDQQSHNTAIDMLSPTSTLLHPANMDQDGQMCMRNRLEVGINNTLCPQIGQAIHINSSSWEHLHSLGTY